MSLPLLEQLKARPLLADGAMGTMLYLRGIPYDRCLDEACLTHADLVQGIHREYIAAGADLVETNTFGANRLKLERFGLGGQVVTLNRCAVKLAREARDIAGRDVWVAGSVGPLGKPGLPVELGHEHVLGIFREQIEGLLEGGADLLIFETFSDLDQMVAALEAARAVCSLPRVAQMTFTEEGITLQGHTPEAVARRLAEAGADLVGANCSVGPLAMLEVIQRMSSATELPLAVQPNAGLPQFVDGRFIYLTNPEYFAEYAERFAAAGARLIGGCCGTTPAHVAAMRGALDRLHPEAARVPAPVMVLEKPPEPEPVTTNGGVESFADKLGKRFVISVELDPPRGLNPAKLLRASELMKAEGVDAVNIGDSPMARVRMGALALAFLIQSRVGIETILHFTTRDRNLMGLQSDLIGAHAVGVRNILALTGDPPSVGDYAQATAVYDVDSIGLIKIIRRMNEGFDVAGTSIGSPAHFRIACAVNPSAADLDEEIRRFGLKIEAGAQFAMTQPLYEMSTWTRFLERLGPVKVPILFGVLPLQSSRHAEFLHHEVPGISVPQWARDRMRAAGAEGAAEGARLATELLLEARGHVDGVYLMPSFGRYEQILDVVRAARQEVS